MQALNTCTVRLQIRYLSLFKGEGDFISRLSGFRSRYWTKKKKRKSCISVKTESSEVSTNQNGLFTKHPKVFHKQELLHLGTRAACLLGATKPHGLGPETACTSISQSQHCHSLYGFMDNYFSMMSALFEGLLHLQQEHTLHASVTGPC